MPWAFVHAPGNRFSFKCKLTTPDAQILFGPESAAWINKFNNALRKEEGFFEYPCVSPRWMLRSLKGAPPLIQHKYDVNNPITIPSGTSMGHTPVRRRSWNQWQEATEICINVFIWSLKCGNWFNDRNCCDAAIDLKLAPQVYIGRERERGKERRFALPPYLAGESKNWKWIIHSSLSCGVSSTLLQVLSTIFAVGAL